MNEWFIVYSSSLLDCTRNKKTLKQEHTVQNHSATVSKKIYSYLADYVKFFQTLRQERFVELFVRALIEGKGWEFLKLWIVLLSRRSGNR